MTEAFVLGGVRTPFARYGSLLAHIRADDLLGFLGVVRSFVAEIEAAYYNECVASALGAIIAARRS